jgi:hypothetical protein
VLSGVPNRCCAGALAVSDCLLTFFADRRLVDPPKSLQQRPFKLEARVGIEPTEFSGRNARTSGNTPFEVIPVNGESYKSIECKAAPSSREFDHQKTLSASHG